MYSILLTDTWGNTGIYLTEIVNIIQVLYEDEIVKM